MMIQTAKSMIMYYDSIAEDSLIENREREAHEWIEFVIILF